MAKRISVVVSQGQSGNPAKRDLEESIVTSMLLEAGVDVMVVPHLYDLKSDGTGIMALQGISGPMIVMSWLFERAARWTLDRNDVRGQIGMTLLKSEEDEDEDAEAETADEKERVIDTRPVPKRKIYCIDMRIHSTIEPYVTEIRRIRDELNTQVVGLDSLTSWIGGSPNAQQMDSFLRPRNDTALGGNSGLPPIVSAPSQTNPELSLVALATNLNHSHETAIADPTGPANVVRIQEEPDRRWYPVIDYARCTNCMECIDFCLFGVYGVDRVETILVEQPDNCRKGCPACSRVCPENAIMFPQHKTPAIAGADIKEEGGLKIDLSRLFGAPDKQEDPALVAARERDEQLMMVGREAVGTSVGMPKRQTNKPTGKKDELDSLLDALDELDI